MSKPAIICVDDEPTVLESLKIELRQVLGDSCLIETAESGEEALELFEELQTHYEIALVLADQIMPGLRGDELLKRIHQLSPQTLKIMITGHADLETLSQTLRTAQLYRHIAKPWHSEDLRVTVLEAMQSYRQARELTAQNASLQQAVAQLEQSLSSLQQSESAQQPRHPGLDRIYLALAIQQHQQYQAVQAQVKSLEHLNEVKDRFLDSISSELRSPISNIRMATHMLEVRLQQLDADDTVLQCSRYFQILHTECQREADLITDLLVLIRLDSGTDPLNLTTINLNLWIPQMTEPFGERMQEREQQLLLELPPNLPQITTDLGHLQRTLSELLSNAWKYTPPGEQVILSVQVIHLTASSAEEADLQPVNGRISELVDSPTDRPQAELWISVSNSGIEIPPEEHERIFNQFYRIPTHNAWHQSGTGLGLAIAKKRVEKLRGSISVASQDQQTTFTVKLPLHLTLSALDEDF
ncbi:MAG: hybrid sensor histidine kinase/response regulator [Pegethrix bostrychoides GSE-TBD4-15B]|jgi:signal transduction histidine kinase|uniref:histidine kinase n=1 Tax=Pegethrix bostrychoides GSE-TBD4-15B TaxID=2839662 RepID=A0A951PBT8_9CYAN|nr:hybrid sensor histidine kinase/response regulator [Pegethrix bostrychoides GSE-TBD4-15B]